MVASEFCGSVSAGSLVARGGSRGEDVTKIGKEEEEAQSSVAGVGSWELEEVYCGLCTTASVKSGWRLAEAAFDGDVVIGCRSAGAGGR